MDLTGSGKLDIVCGGRHGLYWLENLGKGSGVAKSLTVFDKEVLSIEEAPRPRKFLR